MSDKKKILLVDDEKSLCRILRLNLEDTGKYTVLTESDGRKAVDVALEFMPDVIVLDYIMPEIDGGEVSKQLAANPRTSHIPIIFLTAIATKEDTQGTGNIIGGHFVIAKPVTVEELDESIQQRIAELG